VLRTAVLTLERAGPTRHERGASRRRCVQRGSPCCISMRAVRRHVRSLGSPDEVAVAVGFAQKNRSHPVVADDLPAAAVLVEQPSKTWVSRSRFVSYLPAL
jgi:hypothetical protein